MLEPVHGPEARAQEAERSVRTAFGHRLAGLPGTHLAATRWPDPLPRRLRRPWHYWWQAHYLDALVDAALRGQRQRSSSPDSPASPEGQDPQAPGQLAVQLVRTIRLRNLLRYTNWYFDDMAWLALAAGRLSSLTASRGPLPRLNRRINRTLTAALESAHTPDLGGGVFWNRSRNFKNTPATAPAALHFLRNGDRERAQALVDWLNETLLDAKTGLYLDGVKIRRNGMSVERAVFSYNQGPVLGALLGLGGAANLERAANLVDAVARHLTVASGSTRVLTTHGTGDAGLFTGILARYLAEAAASPTLPEPQRRAAADLVSASAEAWWQGRTSRGEWTIFSPHPLEPAKAAYPDGTAVELSTQLQAWICLEAAVRVQRLEPGLR